VERDAPTRGDVSLSFLCVARTRSCSQARKDTLSILDTGVSLNRRRAVRRSERKARDATRGACESRFSGDDNRSRELTARPHEAEFDRFSEICQWNSRDFSVSHIRRCRDVTRERERERERERGGIEMEVQRRYLKCSVGDDKRADGKKKRSRS